MSVNKNLLRLALVDGAFSQPQNMPKGSPMVLVPGRLTADVLASVSALTDDQVTAVLTQYVDTKTKRQNDVIANANEAITNAQAAIKALQA